MMLQQLNQWWQKFKKIWTEEWTALWGWLCTSSGLIGGILSHPDFKSALIPLNLDPKIMLGITIIGLLTLMSMPHPENN